MKVTVCLGFIEDEYASRQAETLRQSDQECEFRVYVFTCL